MAIAYTGTGGLGTSLSEKVTVSYPTKSVGDIIIAIVADADADAFVTPTGWNLLFQDASSTQLTYAVFWRRIDGTEGSNQSFTGASTAGSLVWGIMAGYSGCVTTGNPFVNISGDLVGASRKSTHAKTIIGRAGLFKVVLHVIEDDTAVTDNGDADWTTDLNRATTTASDGRIIAESSTNTGSTTSSFTTGTSEYSGSIAFALVPQSNVPTIALNTADATDFGADTTPTLEFTGSDANGDDLDYQIQIDSVTTFDSLDSVFELKEIRLALERANAPTDTVTVKVYSGSINGTLLGTAVAMDYTDVGNSTYSDNYFQFATPISLTAGTKYYFQVERTGARDVSNRYWVFRTSLSAIDNGGVYTRNSNTWSSEGTPDLCFSLFDVNGVQIFDIPYESGLNFEELYGGTAGSGETFQAVGQGFTLPSDPTTLIDKTTEKKEAAYFDGSDVAATDDGLAWAGVTNSDDGLLYSTAVNGAVGASSNLVIEGTNYSGGENIVAVRARIFGKGGGSSAILYAGIYENGGSTLLATAENPSNNLAWGEWFDLTAHSGGWTAAKVQALETKIYTTSAGGEVGRLELQIITADLEFTNTVTGVDEPPYNEAEKADYTVQIADALPGSTTYYWRVRAKDSNGDNIWSGWATYRSFDIGSSGTNVSVIAGLNTAAFALLGVTVSTEQNVTISTGLLTAIFALQPTTVVSEQNISTDASLLSAVFTLQSVAVTTEVNVNINANLLTAIFQLEPEGVSVVENIIINAGINAGVFVLQPVSVSAIQNVSFEVGVLAASFSLLEETVSTSLNVSTGVGLQTANFVLQSATVSTEVNVSVNIGFLTAAFQLQTAAVTTEVNVNVSLGLLTATLQLQPEGVDAIENIQVNGGLQTALFVLHPVSVTVVQNISVEVGVLNAAFVLLEETVSAIENTSITADLQAANFTLLPVTVSASQNINVALGLLAASLQIHPVTVSTGGNVSISANTLNASLNIEPTTQSGSANTIPETNTGVFSLLPITVSAIQNVNVSLSYFQASFQLQAEGVDVVQNININIGVEAANFSLKPVTVTTVRNVSIDTNTLSAIFTLQESTVSQTGNIVVNTNSLLAEFFIQPVTVIATRSVSIPLEALDGNFSLLSANIEADSLVAAFLKSAAFQLLPVSVSVTQNIEITVNLLSAALQLLPATATGSEIAKVVELIYANSEVCLTAREKSMIRKDFNGNSYILINLTKESYTLAEDDAKSILISDDINNSNVL